MRYLPAGEVFLMEPAGEMRDQVAVHMAAARKAVQQDDGRVSGVSRLAVEDLATFHGREMIGCRVHGSGFLRIGGVRRIGGNRPARGRADGRPRVCQAAARASTSGKSMSVLKTSLT